MSILYLLFFLITLGLSHPIFAAEGLLEEIDICAKIKEPIARLKCYDALQEKYKVSRGRWKIKTKIYPDESRHIYLTLRADKPVEAYSEKYTPTLVLRCKEEKTVVYIITGIAPSIDHEEDGVGVLLRFDNERAKEYLFTSKSTKDQILFAPNPISLINKMLKHKTMQFQFTPLNTFPTMTTFNLAGLATVIDELQSACHWK